MPEDLDLDAQALEHCNNLPFHIPGTIQSFGYLIGLDKTCGDTLYVSENIEAFLGIPAKEVLNRKPDDYLPHDLLHDIRNRVGRKSARVQRVLVGEVPLEDKILTVACHVQGDVVIIEATETSNAMMTAGTGLDQLRWLTERFRYGMEVDEILDSAVKSLRSFARFHRVVAYRFRPDGSGEVVAESKEAFMESFLGLRFPEFDIPPRVKQLYQKTPIRIIYDVAEQQINVLAQPGLPDLDLSLAILRGTLPQHTQYLQNIGMSASLTLPLVVDGKLWGLLAFHHMQPHHVGGGLDLAMEFAGQYIAMLLKSALATDLDRLEIEFSQSVNALFRQKHDRKAALLAWSGLKDGFIDALPCSGVMVETPDWALSHGTCPPQSSMNSLKPCLRETEDGISFSDSLKQDLKGAPLDQVAGALRVKADDISIFFFRKDSASTVTWAGSPVKALSTDEDGNAILNPRASFAAYQETVKGRSDSWELRDLEVAQGVRRAMLRAQSSLRERDEVLDNLALVVQGLNHRVRNILALVQSIIKQVKPKDAALQLPFDALEARVMALANAHNLLSDSRSKAMDLKSALESEARPYPKDRIHINGPAIGIASRAASIFVLVLHELFSNAAKYGALSDGFGILSVRWRTTPDGLHLDWIESGGPPVCTPDQHRRGFGTMLIQNAFAYEFQGDGRIEFNPSGLTAQLFIPADVLVWTESDERSEDDDVAPDGLGSLSRLGVETVLVVEDDFMIGMQTKSDLTDLGAKHVLMAGNNSEALRLIGTATIDLALLDVNLTGERSLATAEALDERNIPFIFLTGYDSGETSMKRFPNVDVVKKPFENSTLVSALERALKKAQV